MCRRRVERLMRESERGRQRLEETQVRMDAREVEDDRKRAAEGSAGVEPDMYRVRFEGPYGERGQRAQKKISRAEV
eukprot:3163655-Amphidinium_carterae.1